MNIRFDQPKDCPIPLVGMKPPQRTLRHANETFSVKNWISDANQSAKEMTVFVSKDCYVYDVQIENETLETCKKAMPWVKETFDYRRQMKPKVSAEVFANKPESEMKADERREFGKEVNYEAFSMYYTSDPFDIVQQGKWAVRYLVEVIRDVYPPTYNIIAGRKVYSHRFHTRGLYYKLLSDKYGIAFPRRGQSLEMRPLEATKNDYDLLIDFLADARHAGLIDYEQIVDYRSDSDVHGLADRPFVQSEAEVNLTPKVEFFLDIKTPRLPLNIPCIILFTEKKEIAYILQELADEFVLGYYLGEGFPSETSPKLIYEEIKRRSNVGIVLCIHDFDKAGKDICGALFRKIQYHAAEDRDIAKPIIWVRDFLMTKEEIDYLQALNAPAVERNYEKVGLNPPERLTWELDALNMLLGKKFPKAFVAAVGHDVEFNFENEKTLKEFIANKLRKLFNVNAGVLVDRALYSAQAEEITAKIDAKVQEFLNKESNLKTISDELGLKVFDVSGKRLLPDYELTLSKVKERLTQLIENLNTMQVLKTLSEKKDEYWFKPISTQDMNEVRKGIGLSLDAITRWSGPSVNPSEMIKVSELWNEEKKKLDSTYAYVTDKLKDLRAKIQNDLPTNPTPPKRTKKLKAEEKATEGLGLPEVEEKEKKKYKSSKKGLV